LNLRSTYTHEECLRVILYDVMYIKEFRCTDENGLKFSLKCHQYPSHRHHPLRYHL